VRDNIKVRASSLGELFDCPARWEAKQLLGMRTPLGAAAKLGNACHRSTARYDSSTMLGAGITIDEAAADAVDEIWRGDSDAIWDDITQKEAEKIALALHQKYCTIIAPQQTYVAVEVTCEALAISDIGITLTGTTDRVRAVDGGAAISDLKTGKTAVGADGVVKTATHAMQLGVYELLAEHSLGVRITQPAEIIGLQTGKTDKAQRVAKATVDSARDMLIGTEDSPGVLQHAASIVHGAHFYGNPRSQLCGEKYCPLYNTCKYRR
jgi:RecB family exonuclease